MTKFAFFGVILLSSMILYFDIQKNRKNSGKGVEMSTTNMGKEQKKVDIYVTMSCPYCVKAKKLLDSKEVSYNVIDVSHDDDLRNAMVARANGKRTVPQIFVGDVHVGGCDDLYALDQKGDLDPLLFTGNH